MAEKQQDNEVEIEEEFFRRRRARSYAIAAILLGLVVLFYVVTIVKLGPGILDRPF
ncbi:MAG: hypothetical protein JKY32_00655 [Rhizobiales bacterium]|nr:hypothetical protein [Hyphomicrobiales bacterium]